MKYARNLVMLMINDKRAPKVSRPATGLRSAGS
jgi:hypothetical protein